MSVQRSEARTYGTSRQGVSDFNDAAGHEDFRDDNSSSFAINLEARRRSVMFHLHEYLVLRRYRNNSSPQANINSTGLKSSLSPTQQASSDPDNTRQNHDPSTSLVFNDAAPDRHRVQLEASEDILRSELNMLQDLLSYIRPKASKGVIRSGLLFAMM
ncbi:hypothetical protein B7463_g12315, partial [Scytalidium lignicola]